MHFVDVVRHLPALTPDEAEHWVAAALAEAKALRQHDARLYPLNDNPVAIEAARHLHAAWRRWADDAEALVQLIRNASIKPACLDALRENIGFARCLGQMSIDEVARRYRDCARGLSRPFNIQEARRGLGAAHLG